MEFKEVKKTCFWILCIALILFSMRISNIVCNYKTIKNYGRIPYVQDQGIISALNQLVSGSDYRSEDLFHLFSEVDLMMIFY
jgi:hypothetical protein